jgi:SAM-dependent methyltransferase
VDTHVADAQALPFPADTFDGLLANRVLQHLSDPTSAVREMLRVAARGATIAMADPDWETFTVEPSGGRTGQVITSLRMAQVANPRIGRDLGPLLTAHGACEVAVLPLEWNMGDYAAANILFRLEETAERAAASGAVTPEAAEEWVAALRSAANHGRFAASFTVYVARGRKPDSAL